MENVFQPGWIQTSSGSYFLKKKHRLSRTLFNFWYSPVIKITHHEYLGLILDEKLNFKEHLKEEMSKAYKGIAVLRKLQNIIPRNSVLTICESFIRPPVRLWWYYLPPT